MQALHIGSLPMARRITPTILYGGMIPATDMHTERVNGLPTGARGILYGRTSGAMRMRIASKTLPFLQALLAFRLLTARRMVMYLPIFSRIALPRYSGTHR